MDNNTQGLYIESVNKLFVVLESRWTKGVQLERLKRILLARDLVDLKQLGNISGKLTTEQNLKKFMPQIMTVAEAKKRSIPIEEVAITSVDYERKLKADKLAEETKPKAGIFGKKSLVE